MTRSFDASHIDFSASGAWPLWSWVSGDRPARGLRSGLVLGEFSYFAPSERVSIFTAQGHSKTGDGNEQFLTLMQANPAERPTAERMRFVTGGTGWRSPFQGQCMPRMIA
jgi:hypothetical protein